MPALHQLHWLPICAYVALYIFIFCLILDQCFYALICSSEQYSYLEYSVALELDVFKNISKYTAICNYEVILRKHSLDLTECGFRFAAVSEFLTSCME